MTAYRRGADFERAVCTALRAEGYTVVRSAGSRSIVDVVALRPGVVVLIQAKRDGRCSPGERAELLRAAACIEAVPVVAYRLPRKGILYRRLTGTGPRDFEPWTADRTADGDSGAVANADNTG